MEKPLYDFSKNTVCEIRHVCNNLDSLFLTLRQCYSGKEAVKCHPFTLMGFLLHPWYEDESYCLFCLFYNQCRSLFE